ncbi:MAG: NPCBM/NEW2 domain-containing protein [Planctomycetota bacterium]
MTVLKQFPIHLTFLAATLVAVVFSQHVTAATVMLSSGEPDPNGENLRLWLRADSGIKDTQGRSPADPDFNGMVAAWNDRSSNKFNLAAVPQRAPLFVARQPAAGNRPTVAFNGEQALSRSNAMLNDRATSTVVLVVQSQMGNGPSSNHPYSVGTGQNKRETLALHSRGDGFARVHVCYLTNRGERAYSLDLTLPSDGRGEGRFAAIISNGEVDRHTVEFHDGLSNLVGGDRAVALLGLLKPESDRCGRTLELGGHEGELFCGQIAEMIVYNRSLSFAERRDMLAYLRHRYEFDMTDAILPTGTFILQAENFEGNWRCLPAHIPAEAGRYLGDRHVTAEGEPADEGIRTTINVPRNGTYHVWVRALENSVKVRGPGNSALKTSVQGKELRVTHARGPDAVVVWREAGQIELKSGPAEIVIRGEGPGGKDCDAMLVSPTATTPEAVENICALAQRIRRMGGESRLTAVYENGLRLDGSLLTGWRWIGPSGKVSRPDPAAMPTRVCVQFDRRCAESDRQPMAPAEAMLEFQNGDRMVGTICGYVPASTKENQAVSSQLIVRPPIGFLQDPKQTVSVDTDWLRRIIFDPSLRDRPCLPKTLTCRNGRRYAFRAVRWGADSVSVLTEESLERIPLIEIADLQLSPMDAWDTYFRELSILDPEGSAEIVRVETAEGMVITASTNRSSSGASSLLHRPHERGADPAKLRRDRVLEASLRWMQPVWSHDPIPVPWARLRLLWQAPAHRIPLSRFAPQQVTQRGSLGPSWKWQTDRNVAGGILRSEGMDYLWGFGVHAPNEMVFALPDCVRAFRASVGIDAVVGNAGCAIAKVYINQANGTPLYQSQPLVGSRMPVSTGEIALPPAAGTARQLVLVTENSSEVSGGGDGLDIGNHVDWLEPMLLLDPALLHAEVSKHFAN